MENKITGLMVAISPVEEIPTKKGDKMSKRRITIDCSRCNPRTGEVYEENTPMLEFTGKGLERLEELIAQGVKVGDRITVSFNVKGINYKDKNGASAIFTTIKPYDIMPAESPQHQPVSQNAPFQPVQSVSTQSQPQPEPDALPF